MPQSYIAGFIWLALTVVFGAVELATVQLTTVWFALGASVCTVLSFAGVTNIIVQIGVFTAVSVIALIATRPLVRKITRKNKQPTNADMNIGRSASVTEEIDNLRGSGTVEIGGIPWSAKSASGEVIPAGATVTVTAIEGVKAVVRREDRN